MVEGLETNWLINDMARNSNFFDLHSVRAMLPALNWFWIEEEIISRMREIEEDINKKMNIKMLDYGVKFFQHTE